METIILTHRWMEHFIYLLAGLAVIFTLIDVIRKKSLSTPAIWAVRIYSIVLTLQFLIGLIQLILRWSDFGDGLRYRIEHATIMLLALTSVHLAPRYMKLADTKGARNTMFLMVGSIILIVLGTTLIKGALHG
jgi:hypothetical protein